MIQKDRALSAGELIDYYKMLVKLYPIVSIEDPFYQEDVVHFAELKRELRGKVQIVADDLTTTNPQRIRLAARQNAANAVIIKPNQIGTITETLDAVRTARMHGWKVMVSHRSGETTDDFISDLAVGVGAEMMKSGAPAHGERVAKYNQLMRIEEMLR
jgi:enolase